MDFLEFKSVSKKFGPKSAVQDVSFGVREGAFLTLLGPSGSGKTTLLMMLAGFLSPSSGLLFVGGRDITSLPPEKRNLGVVFQGYALFPHMTVAENISFPLRVRRVEQQQIRRRVEEMLDLVQLTGLGNRLPGELSGGQQQRVALARALAFDPPILLLDEPLSALDRLLREQLQHEIKRLHRAIGKTFVFVTHDQDEALALSTDIAILRDGRVEQFGGPHQLYREPANTFVASFLGTSNLLKPQSVSTTPDGSRGIVGSTTIRAPKLPFGKEGHAEGYILAIRAENIRVGLSAPSDDLHNAIPVSIQQADFRGDIFSLILDTGEGVLLKARIPAREIDQQLLERPSVYAIWRPEDVSWLPNAQVSGS